MPTPQELADILKNLIATNQSIPQMPTDPVTGQEVPATSVLSLPGYQDPPAAAAVPDPATQWLRDAQASTASNPIDVRVAALNRNFNASNITASKDDKGQLVLNGSGPVGADLVDGSVRGIINQMRNTTDIDVARGLQAQLNEAAAQESTRINNEARKHAENKLGIPYLEQNLDKMIQLDRYSPSYFPGRGDSDNTARARAALNTARGAADLEAQRMLKSNVSANGLDAAIKTASMETARISRLADKKDMLDAQAGVRADAAEAARVAKQDALDEKLDTQAEGLSEQTKQAIRTLNPALANGTTRDLAANFIKGKANPHYIAAITAPDTELPLLAASGNDFSTALVKSREDALGIKSIETEAKLRQIQEIMRSPSKLQAALKVVTPGGPDADKQIKAAVADMGAKSSGTPEEKSMALRSKYEIARKVVAQGITHSYMADVNNWNSTDPGLQSAVLQAKSVTGKTDITEVANAYIGSATGVEGRQRLDQLIQIMTQQASASKNSLFGMPDTMVLRNKLIADQLRTRLQAGPLGTMLGLKGGNGIIPNAVGTDRQTLFGAPFNGK